ncbi:MAG: type II toxin-antitoxin system death-on-curing family toxin [Planctomycetes bacterium]|nr:type II toxin-antitoxin system death-on-curing family toxin [Planctomycetota bacterium]
MEPLFLSWEEVLAQHAEHLRRYGGTPGIRDEGLLRSALAQPEAQFGGQWLHEDLPAMAAAYGYHLAQIHPFVDGNKRAAAGCMLLFLALNGQRVVTPPGSLATIILDLAAGKAGKDDLATWLRAHLKPWRPGRV